jgi:hypothetical protein
MNQRIKELAEQAGYSKDYLAIGLPGNTEKFAELIVLACSEIAAQQGRVGWNDDRKAQARVDSELIKNHFGITS